MSLSALTALLLTTLLAPPAVAWLRVGLDSSRPSKSRGTPAAGSLVDGHMMPPAGTGYVTYSYLGAALGRQYVHGAVRDALREAFAEAARSEAGRCFQLAETGFKKGGTFTPHRTHKNGLSVDILVPVADPQGRPEQLPTWPWKRLGYGWDFDERGRIAGAGTYQIDFEALARLLLAIDKQAAAHHLRIEKLILTPEYLPLLYATPSGQKLGSLRGRFLPRPAWVRHDEHFHIDFERTTAD